MIKEFKGIDTKIEIEKLNNGLTVFFIPFKGRKKYYIEYLTKYGSLINKFKNMNEKKYNTVPFGIAHFLEHKLFEDENINPFAFYSKYGTECNASTSYEYTNYYIEGVYNLKECLDYLIKCVNHPYFTNKNVEKEKGIITEELNMYNDNPYMKLSRKSVEAVFKNHNVRIDIGGTTKSIKNITKEDLYKCYESFYKPENMYLFVAGNFDKDEVLEVLKNNEKIISDKNKNIVEVKKEIEPYDVNIKYQEISLKGLTIPKLLYSFKISLAGFKDKDKYVYNLITRNILYKVYGPSSDFYLDGLNNSIFTDFVYSTDIIDDFLVIDLAAEGKDPKKVIPLIKKYYDKTNIEIIDIKRYMKASIVSEINKFDNVSNIVDVIRDDLLTYGEIIYNKLDIMKNVSLEEVNKIKNNIDFDNVSIIVASPK